MERSILEYAEFITGVLKTVMYKLVYGKRLQVSGICKLGRGAVIHIRDEGRISIGKKCSFAKNSYISAGNSGILTIKRNSGINQDTKIVARLKIEIGEKVLIGPNVCIYDHDHIFKENTDIKDSGLCCKPIKIEDNVWIGSGAVILKGVCIGSGSVIGAGTVVTKNVPPGTVVYEKRMQIQENIVNGNVCERRQNEADK